MTPSQRSRIVWGPALFVWQFQQEKARQIAAVRQERPWLDDDGARAFLAARMASGPTLPAYDNVRQEWDDR